MNERILEILRNDRGWLSEAQIAAAGGWRSAVHVRLQLRVLEIERRVERQNASAAHHGTLWRYVSPAVQAMAEAPPTSRQRFTRVTG